MDQVNKNEINKFDLVLVNYYYYRTVRKYSILSKRLKRLLKCVHLVFVYLVQAPNTFQNKYQTFNGLNYSNVHILIEINLHIRTATTYQ